MVARTRHQDDWVLNLYRAAQAAIGQELRIECEPPRQLTPELTVVLRKLDEPTTRGGDRKSKDASHPLITLASHKAS